MPWGPELDAGKEEVNGKTAEIKIKSGLQVTVMYLCKFIRFVKCIMEIPGVNSEENQVKYIWELTILSSQDFCKSKHIIKGKTMFLKKNDRNIKKQNKKVDVRYCSQA